MISRFAAEATGLGVYGVRVTNATAVETLRRFNERAARLNERRFLAGLRAGKGAYTIGGQADGRPFVSGDLADAEEIEAYALTYRLFLQDNDPISLRRMSRLYASVAVVTSLLPRIEAIRSHLNAYLDSKSPIIWEKDHFTNRRIQDVFLYGGLAHTHPKKSAEYAKWMSHEVMAIPIQSHFYDIVAVTTSAIFGVRRVNLEALTLLGADA